MATIQKARQFLLNQDNLRAFMEIVDHADVDPTSRTESATENLAMVSIFLISIWADGVVWDLAGLVIMMMLS